MLRPLLQRNGLVHLLPDFVDALVVQPGEREAVDQGCGALVAEADAGGESGDDARMGFLPERCVKWVNTSKIRA